MTVYVDDMLMEAEGPNGTRTVRGEWSHMIADTREELHAFASRLGLKREWFKEPTFRGKPCLPTSRAAQNWHYEVTSSVRMRAIAMGAIPVTVRQMADIINDRHRRLFPDQAATEDSFDHPEPPTRCSKHIDEHAYYPCVPCTTQHQLWLEWHRERRHVESTKSAAELARLTADRARGIAACGLCDDHGWLNGLPCFHDPDAPHRAQRGLQACREALAQ